MVSKIVTTGARFAAKKSATKLWKKCLIRMKILVGR